MVARVLRPKGPSMILFGRFPESIPQFSLGKTAEQRRMSSFGRSRVIKSKCTTRTFRFFISAGFSPKLFWIFSLRNNRITFDQNHLFLGPTADIFSEIERSPLKTIPALSHGNQAGTLFDGVREKIAELRCAPEAFGFVQLQGSQSEMELATVTDLRSSAKIFFCEVLHHSDNLQKLSPLINQK